MVPPLRPDFHLFFTEKKTPARMQPCLIKRRWKTHTQKKKKREVFFYIMDSLRPSEEKRRAFFLSLSLILDDLLKFIFLDG
jgi:hypothetical protein